MLKNLILTILIINSVGLYSQDISNTRNIFDSTINLIKRNKDTINDPVNGYFTKVVAESVMSIVNSNDTIISDSMKLDLLFIMLLNQRFSTQYYRAMLFNRIILGDSVILSKPLFILPFLFCNYCQSTKVFNSLEYSTLTFNDKISSLPKHYKEIYLIYNSILSQIDPLKLNDDKLTYNLTDSRPFVKLKKILADKYQF